MLLSSPERKVLLGSIYSEPFDSVRPVISPWVSLVIIYDSKTLPELPELSQFDTGNAEDLIEKRIFGKKKKKGLPSSVLLR